MRHVLLILNDSFCGDEEFCMNPLTDWIHF